MDAPAAIALVRSTSLSTLVEGEVLRMILTGELDAGQQIKEVAVAERLGVGRSSVREALRALEAAGLVRIEKNRGAFVRVVSEAEVKPGRFWPRFAAVTKARSRLLPANTTSRGSSPTCRVRSTRGVPSRRTTLTESER